MGACPPWRAIAGGRKKLLPFTINGRRMNKDVSSTEQNLAVAVDVLRKCPSGKIRTFLDLRR